MKVFRNLAAQYVNSVIGERIYDLTRMWSSTSGEVEARTSLLGSDLKFKFWTLNSTGDIPVCWPAELENQQQRKVEGTGEKTLSRNVSAGCHHIAPWSWIYITIPWLLLSILQGQGNDIRWNLQPACLKEHDCFGKVQNPKLYFFTSSRTMICHSLKWRRGEGCAAHSWVNSSTFCDNTVTVGFLWPGQFFHILAFWWYTAIARCKILEV